MFRLIVISEAQNRIAETADYLFTHWSDTVKDSFTSKVERCLKIINNNPFAFAIDHNIPKVRKCTITPLNILYYMIQDDNIVILSLEDTRMNPENRKLI